MSVEAAQAYLDRISPEPFLRRCMNSIVGFNTDDIPKMNQTYYVFSNEIEQFHATGFDNSVTSKYDLNAYTQYMNTIIVAGHNLTHSGDYFREHAIKFWQLDMMFDHFIFAAQEQPVDPLVFKLATGLNIVQFTDITIGSLVHHT